MSPANKSGELLPQNLLRMNKELGTQRSSCTRHHSHIRKLLINNNRQFRGQFVHSADRLWRRLIYEDSEMLLQIICGNGNVAEGHFIESLEYS